ncbi:MAG TPA: TylF/MycF/NovP-related O-methyltransferase [Pirellulaceae bacterium]|nr:TylF/MycF/NovP-related O-methyltransferase [Pirellulaceae bacterium]HMO93331.1 TylF/MycF/NovP-related O-methyltransferase [Pirellulaceae bacterium]HMP70102.1 TylF/MycF/NovP-related O-methyltransferase [Pirellulaceae bacterium]
MRLFRRRPKSANHDSRSAVQPQLPDIDDKTRQTIDAVRPYTMTSPERITALCNAVDYLVRNQIEGDIVECGVWRGGSMLAAIRTLLDHQDRHRQVWLYDTFEGMTEPGQADVDFIGRRAETLLAEQARADEESVWCVSQLEQVKQLLDASGYNQQLIHYIQGAVEETIPAHIPDRIALLRLDTDWYSSTKHELVHLLPKLAVGGVLIVDDYGHWHGCRKAVDEYFEKYRIPMLLNRIDYTGRIGVLLKSVAAA